MRRFPTRGRARSHPRPAPSATTPTSSPISGPCTSTTTRSRPARSAAMGTLRSRFRSGCRASCALAPSARRRASGARRRVSQGELPAATRLSLFASARSTPRSSAQSVAGKPAKPTTAFRTRSGSARSSSSVRSPPVCVSGASPSTGLRARCGGAELEPRMRLDDLQRLAADRACGAEKRNPLHSRKCRFAAVIRPGTAEDAEGVARVQVETWQAAYAHALPPDQLEALSLSEAVERPPEVAA